MREIKKYKKKLSILYTMLVIVIIIFTFTLTYALLDNNFKETGNVKFNNNYYDINITNVSMDYETLSKVTTSKDKININIPDLINYKNGNTISIELTNLGSIDAALNSINIVNISGNIDTNKLKITPSLKSGDVILASSKKILKVDIKYNSGNIKDTDNVSFDILLSFKEVVK